tara:strand:+ start:42644 stop:42775 length:132 start_codon:yes stop_codon:yes gene_type:complete
MGVSWFISPLVILGFAFPVLIGVAYCIYRINQECKKLDKEKET